MLGRALSLAAVSMLVGCLAALPARAQNLEAGKSPSQIFSGACALCHKSPRGLLKTVAPGSLPGFLRQHYTTSGDMASALSAYLISNGAVDKRYGAPPPRQAREAQPAPAPQPAATPFWWRRPAEATPDEAAQAPAEEQATTHRRGRKHKRHARPEQVQAPEGANPEVAGEQQGRKSSRKTRHGKKGKHEPAKDESRQNEVPKATDSGKAESAKPDAVKSEGSKADDAGKAASPAEKPSEPKASEPKASEPKSSEPKSSETKPSSETKSSEPKASESKPAESKPAEAPAAAAPASDGEKAGSK